MRQSQIFTATKRQISADEKSKNAIILERGGYIHKTMAGVYSFLPLGLKVIQKISQIVREEMDRLPQTSEVLMSVMQSKEVWSQTGRWDDPGMREVMYRVESHDGSAELSTGLGATHEENITDIFRTLYASYKELPINAYQIQTKFRKELRPKSGLLRGREFLMKDLYSFHLTEEEHNQYYEQVAAAYLKVFERCGLEVVRTEASGGVFSKTHSDEFQALAPEGEDTIYLRADGQLAWNKEVVTDENDPKVLEFCGGELKKANAIEVGNIFHLGRKYSESLGAVVTLESGERVPAWMGSYGIGISRLMGTVAEIKGEIFEDGKVKMVWPESIAPVRVHLLDLSQDGSAETIYQSLLQSGVAVLLDDREKTPGEKFSDADLIGAPHRLVISKRAAEQGGVEYQKMLTGELQIIAPDQILNLFV